MQPDTAQEETAPAPARPVRLPVRWIAIFGAGAVVLALSIAGLAEAARTPDPTRPSGAGDQPPAALLEGLDPREHHDDHGARVADLARGHKAVLTLDSALQAHLEAELERYEVPYGAVVAIEPSTGRVLAYVSHSSANPSAGDLVLDATPPAASIFKIITGSALIDAGVGAGDEVCYSGGSSSLHERDLVADPQRDNRCATLADAMGGSINTIFARLAVQHLDSARLGRYASAFGFGQQLPFDVSVPASPIDVPNDTGERLEFARTAAGFWHSHLSPMHGALIAATIANDGRMPRATIVDRVLDARGRVVLRRQPRIHRTVLTPHTAHLVGQMMERTVTSGTARRTFHDAAGRPFLPDIRVAGKTGTLSGSSPYRGYTWWVGFAPVDAPRIAVAALVVNTPRWRIKASYVAREALRAYLVGSGSAEPPPSGDAASE